MEKEVQYGTKSSDLDAVPMREIDVENINDNSYEHKSKETFFSELRNNKTTQSQIIRSVCTSGAFMIMGWTKGQIGPAFPDIMMISGTDLEHGSAFMTSLYTGQLLGSLLAGLIYSKINKFILFGASLAVYSLTVAAIPWCFLYELMVTAHGLLGVCGGILCVAIASEAVDIWGPTPRGRSYLMANNTAYAIASVLAPLVTAPFLLKQPDYISTNTNCTSWNSTSSNPTIYALINGTNQSCLHDVGLTNNNSTTINRSISKLYVAYTISAVLSMLTALLFFILFCKQTPSSKERSQRGNLEFIGTRSSFIKRFQLFNTGVFSAIQSGIDFTFIGYLATFCINYLGWTNTLGAMVTSVAFFTRLLGTLSGMFLVRYIQSHQMLLISAIVSASGFMGLTISAHVYFDVGIWISVCVIGLPFGLMWPNFISWVNENLIPLRSKVSSFIHITTFLGALLAPLLFGYMMEEISLLWFCYLCCAMSIVFVVNSILMFLYTVPTNKR